MTTPQAAAFAVDDEPTGKKKPPAKKSRLAHLENCPGERIETIPGNPTVTRCIDCGEQVTEA